MDKGSLNCRFTNAKHLAEGYSSILISFSTILSCIFPHISLWTFFHLKLFTWKKEYNVWNEILKHMIIWRMTIAERICAWVHPMKNKNGTCWEMFQFNSTQSRYGQLNTLHSIVKFVWCLPYAVLCGEEAILHGIILRVRVVAEISAVMSNHMVKCIETDIS